MKKIIVLLLVCLLCQTPVAAIEKTLSLTNRETQIGLKLNETLILTFPQDDITDYEWQVDNEAVVELQQNGKTLILQAKGYGTSEISFYHTDKGLYQLLVQVIDGVAFSVDNTVLDINQSYQTELVLQPHTEPISDQITYSSSNPSIAAVDQNGVISAMNEGDVLITAKYLGYQTTMKVHVEDKPDFIFERNNFSLKVDETTPIEYQLSIWDQELSLDFFTSDNNIVQVSDDGQLIGINPGNAYVYARVNGQIYQASVEVLSSVSDIQFSESKVSVLLDSTYQIQVQIIPEIYQNTTIIWESKNPEIVTVNNGLITAKKVGKTQVVAHIDNIAREIEVEVYLPLIGIRSAINRLVMTEGQRYPIQVVKIPEMATDMLNLTFTSLNPDIARVDNYGNVMGMAAGETKIFIQAGMFQTSLDVVVTSAISSDGQIRIVGSYSDKEVRFDVRGIDQEHELVLEVPFQNNYNEKGEIAIDVVLDKDLYQNHRFNAKSLILSKDYQDKSIVLRVFDESRNVLFIYNFKRFNAVNSNLWIDSRYVQSEFKNIQSNLYEIVLPVSLVNNDKAWVTLSNDISENSLKIYQPTTEKSLKVASGSEVLINSNNMVQLSQLNQGAYYLSAKQLDTQLMPFILAFFGFLFIIGLIVLFKKYFTPQETVDSAGENNESVNYQHQKQEKNKQN